MPLLLAVVLWFAPIALTQISSQSAPVREAVTVSAADAAKADRAIASLSRGRDPFLARLANRLKDLTLELAAGRPAEPYLVGPLTSLEDSVVDLRRYLGAHASGGGTIRVRVRLTWTTHAPEIYTFTPGGLLAMLADIAAGPRVSTAYIDGAHRLFTERLVLDLNRQAGEVIPREVVFVALASAFKDKAIGDRILGVVQALALDGVAYDLVPSARLQEFRERAVSGFLVTARARSVGVIHVRYGEQYFTTQPADLIWSYLRLFAGDNSQDWQQRAEAHGRSTLGGDVIEYLEAQVVGHAIDLLLVATGPPVIVVDGEVRLVEYRTNNPAANFLSLGPGVVRRPGPDGASWIFSVRAESLDVFRFWLADLRKGSVRGWEP